MAVSAARSAMAFFAASMPRMGETIGPNMSSISFLKSKASCFSSPGLLLISAMHLFPGRGLYRYDMRRCCFNADSGAIVPLAFAR